MKHFQCILTTCLIPFILFFSINIAQAQDNSNPKIYKEMDFIKVVNGKTREDVAKILGEPVKKTVPVMPTNAAKIVQENAQINTTPKKDTIEMWHYRNLVSYNAKNTYKRTELTFINNKCENITYIN